MTQFDLQSQTAVAAYFSSKQLLLFVFEAQDYRQTAVTAYFSSKQLLLFVFEAQDYCLWI